MAQSKHESISVKGSTKQRLLAHIERYKARDVIPTGFKISVDAYINHLLDAEESLEAHVESKKEIEGE